MSTRTRGIVVYLGIAFGAVWAYLFTARLALGWSLDNPGVQAPVAFVPAIAALIVRRWVTGEGFADAGLRPRFRAAWRIWVWALVGPAAITLAVLALAAAVGWWHFTLSPAGGPGGILLLIGVSVALTPLYWGEEFGWTSFLWPRLIPRRPRTSALVTGLIWAVWHYPLAYLGYTTFTDHTVSMLLWTVEFVLFEILLCWLYLRSGSVWVTSLGHAGNNMVMGLLSETLLTDTGHINQLRIMLVSTVVLGAVAVPLLLRITSTVYGRRPSPVRAG